MSLQVWLPLTKDTRNQGLATGTINWTTTASFTNNGKLGKALTTGGCKMPASMTAQALNNQAVTIACWLFVNADADDSTNRAMIFGTDSTSSLGGRQFSIFRYPNSDDIHLSWQNCINGTYSLVVGGVWSGVLTPHAWNHVCVTYDNPNVKIYVNGVQVGSTSGVMNTDSFAYDTQLIWNSTSHYINDFRIYDHCLSPMEVKELSKGLVLHYPLNRGGWGQENLVTGSNTNSLSTNNWAIGSQTGGNTRTIEQDETGTYCVKFVRDSTAQSGWYYLSYGNLLRNQIKTNTTYTLTFDCKASVNSSITFTGLLNGNATNYMTNSTTNIQSTVVANQWCHMKYQCKTINSFENITIGSQVVYLAPQAALKATGVTIYFKNIKLEEGSIATPWCPNSSDTLATTMGLNGTIEYDCSGFCNNGEKTGTFTYTSDTPKYVVSTTLGNNTTKLHISGLSTAGFANSYSFAWWGKASTFSNMMQWGFSDGIRLNGIYNGTLWNTGDGSNNPLYNPGTTTQVTAPTTNVWHHYVMVGDGTTCKVYKDGVLWGQAKTYKAISGTSIYFNGWDSGTSYCHTTGYSMSDFRIYATALSADDVKSLYQNCATIDADGTIYGQIRN